MDTENSIQIGKDSANAEPVPASPPLLKGHIPQLDGIRGMAILLVLITHCANQIGPSPQTSAGRLLYELAKFGWSGVDLFFVLSGFLIIGILIDQKIDCQKRGASFFGSFYARRSLRIFPLYYAALISVFLLVPLATSMPLETSNLVVYGLYLQNILPTDGLVLTHFWSLAVEEHFYLVLPLVIWFVPHCHLKKVLIGMAFVAIALRFILEGGTINVYRFSPCRFDSLVIGGLLAMEFRQGTPSRKGAWLLLLLSGIALAIICGLAGTGDNQVWIYRTIGYTVVAVFFCSFIRCAILAKPSELLFRFCTSPALVALGVVSYCVYVVHWPIRLVMVRLLPETFPWYMAFPIILVSVTLISYAIASVSWRFFESPFIRLKKYFYTPHQA